MGQNLACLENESIFPRSEVEVEVEEFFLPTHCPTPEGQLFVGAKIRDLKKQPSSEAWKPTPKMIFLGGEVFKLFRSRTHLSRACLTDNPPFLTEMEKSHCTKRNLFLRYVFSCPSFSSTPYTTKDSREKTSFTVLLQCRDFEDFVLGKSQRDTQSSLTENTPFSRSAPSRSSGVGFRKADFS